MIGVFAKPVVQGAEQGSEYEGNAGVGFEGVYVFQSSTEEDQTSPPVEPKPTLPQTGTKEERLSNLLIVGGLLFAGLAINQLKEGQGLNKRPEV